MFFFSNMKLKIYLLILFSTALSSCIQEIELYESGDNPLVVSGIITNEPKAHNIRIILLGDNENPVIAYNNVSGSDVRIIDDLGNEEELYYTEYGNFYTRNDFSGEIGRTYHLEITLPDGKKYHSLPEHMLPTPQIDEVNWEAKGGMITLKANYSDPEPTTRNFYRWRYQGTYEVFSPLAVGQSTSSDRGRCYPASMLKDRKATCWVTENDLEFLRIESDEFIEGKTVYDVAVYSTELDRRFEYGYSGLIEQQSLTPNAYKYWSAIKDQLGNGGTIFETSNYQIVGNLRSNDNPEELVLGYFQVSSVSKKRAFVESYIGTFGDIECVANNNGCMPIKCLNCLSYGFSASPDAPDYWPN